MARGDGQEELRPGAVLDSTDRVIRTDVLVIGSGMGGGTAAWALRDSGHSVLIAERGDFLPREAENSDPAEVFLAGRYRTETPWIDGNTRKPFQPGAYYWVGGNTKMYGACLPRFRESDFDAVRHPDGVSPRWPYGYADIEPFYAMAEQVFDVHGAAGEDPNEPPRSSPFPAAALEHEPVIERLADRFRRQGLKPFHMPNGMSLDTIEDRRRNTAADGSPSEDGAKSDAENRAVRPALRSPNVTIATRMRIDRLVATADGRRIVSAEASLDGEPRTIIASKYVLAAGAVNSAAILLSSPGANGPGTLANSSGLVGRNYMQHNATFLVGLNPLRVNDTAWQKTLGLNDWYEAAADRPPLGSVQMLGKLQGAMVKGAMPLIPTRVLDGALRRSVDFFLLSEDLPRTDNRVEVVSRRPVVRWTPTNVSAHRALRRQVSTAVRRAGYPFVLTQSMGIASNSHMCGTLVAGDDRTASVLDRDCRAHDVDNLWVVDSSFFPSSAALNPALTVAANALRVAPLVAAASD